VLDLLEVVAVRRLVHGQLLLVASQLLFGLLELEGEFGCRGAIARLQVRLGLGLEFLYVRPVGRHLTGDALHQPAVLLEASSALLELLDRVVVFIAHLRDRIGLPEQIRDLVDLRDEGGPELVKNHNHLTS
jgi:hypothetical protein